MMYGGKLLNTHNSTQNRKNRISHVVLTLGMIAINTQVFALNPDVANMPANTWKKIESGGLATSAGILGYSGMAYDSVNQQLLVFGGGHNDYGGNEIWAFDTNTSIWKKMYEPDPASAYNYSNYSDAQPGLLMGTGRPLSRHTYDNVEFIPDPGVLVTYGGYTVDGSTGGGEIGMFFTTDTFTYDFVNNNWSYRANTPNQLIDAPSSTYDVGAKLLVAVISNNCASPCGSETWVYNYYADSWTERFPAQAPPAAAETSKEYDSKRKLVYFFAGEWAVGIVPGSDHSNALWKYDTMQNTWADLQPSGPLPPPGGGYGWAYDSQNDVVIAYKSGFNESTGLRAPDAGTWAYHPSSNSWEQLLAVLDEPKDIAKRVHGNLKYDPVNNVTWLVSFNENYVIETWAYRYGSSVTDSTPPSIPTIEQTNSLSQNSISLAWSVASDENSGISTYFIYRDGLKIANSSSTTYTDIGLQESVTYNYQVSAQNGGGLEGELSAVVSATTLPDSEPPKLQNVSAGGIPPKVYVTFSEPVSQTSAESVAHYVIEPVVEIKAANISADQYSVMLDTGVLTKGVVYTLTVNNVFDKAATPNVIVTNNTANFEYDAGIVISPSIGGKYITDKMAAGSMTYQDRQGSNVITYLSSIAPEFVGLDYLLTNNDDKYIVDDSYLSFDVNQQVEVIVAFDQRLVNSDTSTFPTWLEDWSNNGQTISTNDTTFELYRKTCDAGTILLGGNQSQQVSSSMYTVIVKPSSANISNNCSISTDVGNGGGGVPSLPPSSPTPFVPPNDGGNGGTPPVNESEPADNGAAALNPLFILGFTVLFIAIRMRRKT